MALQPIGVYAADVGSALPVPINFIRNNLTHMLSSVEIKNNDNKLHVPSSNNDKNKYLSSSDNSMGRFVKENDCFQNI